MSPAETVPQHLASHPFRRYFAMAIILVMALIVAIELPAIYDAVDTGSIVGPWMILAAAVIGPCVYYLFRSGFFGTYRRERNARDARRRRLIRLIMMLAVVELVPMATRSDGYLRLSLLLAGLVIVRFFYVAYRGPRF